MNVHVDVHERGQGSAAQGRGPRHAVRLVHAQARRIYRLPPLPPTSLTLDDSMSGDQRVFFPVKTPAVGPIQASAQALEVRDFF